MNFDRIAEFVLAGQDMPQSALNMAATLLIDTVGVAAGQRAWRRGGSHAIMLLLSMAPVLLNTRPI